MEWFRQENATLLAAIEFAEHQGLDTHLIRLTWACSSFIGRTGQRHARAAINWKALAVARRTGDVGAQMRSMADVARALMRLDRFEEAREILDEALALSTTIDDRESQFSVHWGYTYLLELQHRYREALHHARLAEKLAGPQPTEVRRAGIALAVGRQLAGLGRAGEALPACESALQVFQRDRRLHAIADALSTLGLIHHSLGNHLKAIQCYSECLAVDQNIGARYWEAYVQDRLGDVYWDAGRRDLARKAWLAALSILDILRHPEAESIKTKLAASK